MPIRKVEEGFLNSQEEDIEAISSSFASAVRDICAKLNNGNIIQSCIAQYVFENPNRDVLAETQQLFYFSSSKIPEGFITRKELENALQRIKNYYFVLLPGYTIRRHKKDLDRFFENILSYSWNSIGSLQKF